jgi:hypothetical protein
VDRAACDPFPHHRSAIQWQEPRLIAMRLMIRNRRPPRSGAPTDSGIHEQTVGRYSGPIRRYPDRAGEAAVFRLEIANLAYISIFKCFTARRWNNRHRLHKWNYVPDLYMKVRVVPCRWSNWQIMDRGHNRYCSFQFSAAKLFTPCTRIKTHGFWFPESARRLNAWRLSQAWDAQIRWRTPVNELSKI